MGKYHRPLGYALAAIVFALDQIIKYWATGPLDLPGRGEIILLPIFKFIWVNNPGVAMGMLVADTPTKVLLLTIFTGAIAAFVAVWVWREANRIDVIGLGLILGGALGNILDRVRFGHVIDFMNLHFGDFSPFLVFNVADAAITVGVIILLARAFLTREPKPEAETENA
jgi:signal peptidase II